MSSQKTRILLPVSCALSLEAEEDPLDQEEKNWQERPVLLGESRERGECEERAEDHEQTAAFPLQLPCPTYDEQGHPREDKEGGEQRGPLPAVEHRRQVDGMKQPGGGDQDGEPCRLRCG